MKKQIVIMMAALCFVATGIALNSCNDSDDEKTIESDVTEAAQLKEGQVVCREFTFGDKKIYVEDEMVNYGDADTPVLFSVNKKITIDTPELDGVVFTTDANKFDTFFKRWADLREMPYSTREDKINVAYDVYSFFISLDVDFHLFVRLVVEGYNLRTLRTLVETPALSRASNVPVNDVLYALWSKRDEIPVETRSSDEVEGIIEGITDLYNEWHDFVERSQPIAEAVEGVCSFINDADTDVSHYSLDNYFISPDYALSYWVTGIWHAQLTYVVEGYTGDIPH